MATAVSMESNWLDDGLDKTLTNEIFSILENKFLFGYTDETPSKQVSNSSSSSGRVRILSIDASGSTDGVLAAKALLHLQTILRLKSGNPNAHIADFFDVVSGAGAGGILAALLFTPGKDGSPLFTADEAVKFIADNARKSSSSGGCFFKNGTNNSRKKALSKVFGEMTLRDTLKAVLIPCYDLNTGAPFLFSRADALEMDGCDFRMAGVCGATAAATRPLELKSTDGTTKVMALGGGVAMSNPTVAAVTHVLNNKQEFPLCRGVEDLLVVSLGNGDSDSAANTNMASLVRIAGDGAADMVDQAVSMAFGESRSSNYFRIQGNGILAGKKGRNSKTAEKKRNAKLSIADEMLGQKNVESVLFQGKKLVDKTNMEKLETLGGELIKEKERRKNSSLPIVVLKQLTHSPRSSSATTLSTLSSN